MPENSCVLGGPKSHLMQGWIVKTNYLTRPSVVNFGIPLDKSEKEILLCDASRIYSRPVLANLKSLIANINVGFVKMNFVENKEFSYFSQRKIQLAGPTSNEGFSVLYTPTRDAHFECLLKSTKTTLPMNF